jgi:hypothetical protein
MGRLWTGSVPGVGFRTDTEAGIVAGEIPLELFYGDLPPLRLTVDFTLCPTSVYAGICR